MITVGGNIMQWVSCALIGYLIGNINPAFIISKLKGFDIREISKGIIASLIGIHLFPQINCAKILSGSFCILGHIFPFLMKFHGGKGLASLAGVILAFNPHLFLVMLLFEIVLGFSVDYVCVVPISGSVIFTIVYAFMTGDPFGTVLLATVSLVILYKHIENINRILEGKEAHISFLWHKEQEIARLTKNTEA